MVSYGDVLRTRQWIGRTALAVVVIAAFFALSYWQYARTQDQLAAARAALSHQVDYAEVVRPDDRQLPVPALGRRVSVSGTVVPGARALVRDRLDDTGDRGYLVVDAVRIGDGRVVAVLQGWVPTARSAPELTGAITVSGRVQPDENFYPDAPVVAGEPLVTITAAGLLTQWAPRVTQLTPGYVTVTGTPAAAGLRTVAPIVGADPDPPFPWQNVFYTLQWLIFAVLVVVAWLRWLRDDVVAAREAAAAAGQRDRVSLNS